MWFLPISHPERLFTGGLPDARFSNCRDNLHCRFYSRRIWVSLWHFDGKLKPAGASGEFCTEIVKDGLKKAFKENLTGFFWTNGVLAVVGHSLQPRITGALFHQHLVILPGLIVGLFVGVALSGFFNPLVFRRVVLCILIGIGVRLFIVGIQA